MTQPVAGADTPAHPLLIVALLVALSAIIGVAWADSSQPPGGTRTQYGLTLYGTVDLAVQYQSHGTPESDYHPAVTEALINKNSNGSVAGITGNQLSASKIGVKGLEEFGNGWAGVFKLETLFEPQSGNTSDALRALTINNGVGLASQTTAGDSAIAGQFFNGAAYAGLTHSQLGTLTLGRQMTLMAEAMTSYDPMSGAQGFALIGWSGTYMGAGATEEKRLDNSVRYELTVNGVHFGAMFQPKTGSNPGAAQQFVIGLSFPGGSVDAVYAQRNDALAAASLNAPQVAKVGQVCAGTAVPGFACAPLDKALAGAASDNTATAILAKYQLTPAATLFAGYEHIQYQNPSTPVPAGHPTIGGYVLVTVDNAAYPTQKTLGVFWAGLKYRATPKLELTGAYYRYDQNSYATGVNAGCSSAAISNLCGGSLNAVSFLADHRFTRRFDVYGGAMWSQIQGGPANGFLNTSTIAPTIGVRYMI
jgi:predicted porin